MNKRLAICTLFAVTISSCQVFAQAPVPAAPPSSHSAVPQSASANGVIIIGTQPSTTTPSGTNTISSEIWIYDTNIKELMLCSGHVDGGFSCTGKVALAW